MQILILNTSLSNILLSNYLFKIKSKVKLLSIYKYKIIKKH